MHVIKIGLCLSVLFLLPLGARAEMTKLSDSIAIEQFYTVRSGDPLWVSRAKINKDGKILLEGLKNAWQHGLNPAKYHVPQIEDLTETAQLSDEDALWLELMLTDGLVRYAQDLGGMRIRAADLGFNPKHWQQRPETAVVLERLRAHQGGIESFLKSLEPQAKTYQALKAELTYLVNETKDIDDPPRLQFKGLVKPGKGYADIPKLRERFELQDDVPENERYTYDDELAAAVMKFQAERGLKADGIIGERTLHALNVNRKDKIRQLIVNLERLRWVPEDKPKRFIVVNIPSAMLWAVEDGQIKHEMPVIVGRAKRPTPSFVTEIHGVRFNPSWTVPPTIKKEDMLPKLRADSGYFIDKGMELYDGQGENARTVDPTVVDWNAMTEEDVKKLHMVQIPGAHNPLGAIRVLMPNPQNIYLHDTNHHSLFAKYDRAQSSGCIRMKEPEKIADFILSVSKGWKTENIDTIIKVGKTKDIYVDEKMPVYLLYYTVWADERGRVVYGMDIYDDDKKLLQVLEKLDGFVI